MRDLYLVLALASGLYFIVPMVYAVVLAHKPLKGLRAADELKEIERKVWNVGRICGLIAAFIIFIFSLFKFVFYQGA